LNQRRRKSALFKSRVDLESVMSNGMADSKKRDAPRLRKAERRQLEMRAYDPATSSNREKAAFAPSPSR
jgi:hypothetical protein